MNLSKNPILNEKWDYENLKKKNNNIYLEKKTIKYFNNNSEIFKRLLKIKSEEDAGNTDAFNEEKFSILECFKNNLTTKTDFLLDLCVFMSYYEKNGISNYEKKSFNDNKIGEGIINSLINTLPFKIHIPSYNYLGPGTKVNKNYIKNHPPINDLDKAAFEHDLQYFEKDISKRHIADKKLLDTTIKILKNPNEDILQRLTAALIASIMKLKLITGAGVLNKQINNNIISRKFKPLSNLDIDVIRKYLKINNGTILNLDSEGTGTHWVCWILKKNYNNEENYIFFDSIGDSQLPIELLNILNLSEKKNSDIRVIRNLNTFQKPYDPPICGHLCLAFLKYLNMDYYTEKCIDLFTEEFNQDFKKIQWCRYLSDILYNT